MAAGAISQGMIVVGTVATTDGTITELMRYAIANNHSALIRLSVLGQRFNGGAVIEIFGFEVSLLYNRSTGGGTVEQDAGAPVILDPQTTEWFVTGDIDGTDIRIRVTGTAAEDVRWAGRMEILDVEQTVVA